MPAPPRTTRLKRQPAVPTEDKLTLNLGCVDLGQIDLLVQEGFYAHRSDFIRTAIRAQLQTHQAVVEQAVRRHMLVLGLQRFDAAALQAVVDRGEQLDIRVLGLAVLADDVTPDLALRAIGSITVLGALHAPAAVKAALADRPSA